MKTLLGQYSLNEGTNPAGIYLLKVNKTNTRIRCEICSKLTIKILEWRHWLQIVSTELQNNGKLAIFKIFCIFGKLNISSNSFQGDRNPVKPV